MWSFQKLGAGLRQTRSRQWAAFDDSMHLVGTSSRSDSTRVFAVMSVKVPTRRVSRCAPGAATDQQRGGFTRGLC